MGGRKGHAYHSRLSVYHFQSKGVSGCSSKVAVRQGRLTETSESQGGHPQDITPVTVRQLAVEPDEKCYYAVVNWTQGGG